MFVRLFVKCLITNTFLQMIVIIISVCLQRKLWF